MTAADFADWEMCSGAERNEVMTVIYGAHDT